MPITVQWHNPEQKVLMIRVFGKWTAENFRAAHNEVLSLAHSVSHTVDAITDTSRSESLPSNIFKVLHNTLSNPNFPKNARSNIIVSENRQIQVMGSFAEKISPFQMRIAVVNTLDEAVERIATLPELERR